MLADGILTGNSYPIPDKDALRRAAILARSGHGDVAAAKKLIARRARELGVPNPLDSDDDEKAGKSMTDVAQDATSGDNEAREAGLTKADLDAAIAKALEGPKAELATLRAELAKAKAQPVHGGPVLSAAAGASGARRKADGEDHAANAAYYEDWARKVSSPSDAERYLQLAAQERNKITTP